VVLAERAILTTHAVRQSAGNTLCKIPLSANDRGGAAAASETFTLNEAHAVLLRKEKELNFI
jgi:hypothetical protein